MFVATFVIDRNINLPRSFRNKSAKCLLINRASGPDKLPNWVLKEYSYVLALPITSILNAWYREQRVPIDWKMANITPLPKTKMVKDPKKI